MSISDHYTRAKLQPCARPGGPPELAEGADPDPEVGIMLAGGVPRAIGILFGSQEGAKQHVHYSVELRCDVDMEGRPTFDGEFLETQLDLISQVYPSYELLGWYSTGTEPSEDDMRFHRSVCCSTPALWHAGRLTLDFFSLLATQRWRARVSCICFWTQKFEMGQRNCRLGCTSRASSWRMEPHPRCLWRFPSTSTQWNRSVSL